MKGRVAVSEGVKIIREGMGRPDWDGGELNTERVWLCVHTWYSTQE